MFSRPRTAQTPSAPRLPPPNPRRRAGPSGRSGSPRCVHLAIARRVWTTPLPADAPVDARSNELIRTLVSSVEDQIAKGTGPALSARARTPVYVAGPNVPRVPVKLDTGPWADQLKRELAKGVPIPPDAKPSTGSDGVMVVWQPSSDTYWEFFLMQEALHFPQFVGSPQVTGGGQLAAGTYCYKVTALNERGETNAKAAGITVGVAAPGSKVTVGWSGVEGATGYRIYRGSSAATATRLATVSSSSTSFTDTGAGQPGGTPPPTDNTARTPGHWRAAYGGVIPHVSTNPGYYQDLEDSTGQPIERFNWGSSATSLPLAAGLVTKRDLERGRIDHALSIGLPNLTPQTSIIASGQWAFPAQRADGKSTLPAAIPEGARLRLDPSLDLDSLHLSPFVRMLAEAAQRYGMIVQDGSAATVIYGEDPSPYERAGQPNFYKTLAGSPDIHTLASFPWDRLEVTRLSLCSDPRQPCSESAG